MNLDNLKEEFYNQEFTIDTNKLILEIFKQTVICSVRQEATLRELKSIREILKGKTDTDISEYFEENYQEYLNALDERIQSYYYELIQKFLKPSDD